MEAQLYSFTSAEPNYNNVEREALAVVWRTLRLRLFLLGRKFTLVTDHKPLLAIYGGIAVPKVASSRLARWSLILQSYDFDVTYKPGATIPHADALSRLKFDSDKTHKEDAVINHALLDSALPSQVIERAKALIPGDRTAQEVIHKLKTGKWGDRSQCVKSFFRLRDSLKFDDGLLFLGSRLYVPPTMRMEVYDLAHALHTGVGSTLRRLSANVWWPHIKRDVGKWVAECSSCNRLRPRVNKDKTSWPQCNPFERIHAYWCHVNGIGNILIFVDAASGWIESTPQRHRTSNVVISALTDLTSRFGVPKILVTDNGAEFVSADVSKWCLDNGIEKMESPPYHAPSNGVAERGVQTMKRCLEAWKMDVTHINFDDYIKRVLFHHRACCTPAEVVFGRPIRLPLSATFGFGDAVIYTPNNNATAKQLTYVMNRGSNTAWLLDEQDGKIRMAHANQFASTQTRQEEDRSPPVVTTSEPTSTTVRRSTRQRVPRRAMS